MPVLCGMHPSPRLGTCLMTWCRARLPAIGSSGATYPTHTMMLLRQVKAARPLRKRTGIPLSWGGEGLVLYM